MKTFNADIISKPAIKKELEWSDVMIAILEENFLSMSDDQLSSTLGVKLYLVRKKMRELQLIRPKPPRVPKAKTVRVPKKQIEKTYREQRLEQKAIKVRMEQDAAQRRARRNQEVYRTRQVDLTGMQSVRIDHKTWIYVKPGDDIEALKRKYTRHITGNGLSKIEA